MSIRLATVLESAATHRPELRHLCVPVAQIAREPPALLPPKIARRVSPVLWTQSDQLIQTLLVVAQGIPSVPADNIPGEKEELLPARVKLEEDLSNSLHIADVTARLRALMASLTLEVGSNNSVEAGTMLGRIQPFCITLLQSHLSTMAQQLKTLKASYKLTYVVGRIMLDLAQRGFCKPQEESKAEDGEEGDAVEGTGIGAGTGDKNVSAEITEESQVEGLQGEEETEQEQEENGDDDGQDDDAVSMEDDFAGDMGEGKENEEGDESGDEQDSEQDEIVDDVDPLDPGAVDEKFWDGEKEGEGKDKDEQVDGAQQQEGESEMTAKEDREKKGKAQKEEAKETGNDEESKETDKGEDEKDDGGAEDGEVDAIDQEDGLEEAEQAKEHKQDQVDVPEGEALDLPEEMDLDDAQKDAKDDADDMTLEGDEDLDEDDMDAEDRVPDDGSMTGEDDGAEIEDGPAATGMPEDDAMETEEEAGQQVMDVDLSASNEAMGQEADVARGRGGTQQEQVDDTGREAEVDKSEQEDEEAKTADDQPAGTGYARFLSFLHPSRTDQFILVQMHSSRKVVNLKMGQMALSTLLARPYLKTLRKRDRTLEVSAIL